MAYLAVPLSWIEAGKATKEEIFRYFRDNQESFNNDIEALKQTAQVDIIDVKVAGDIQQYTTTEIQKSMPVFKSPFDLTITSFVVAALEGSTSGTLQVDLEVSEDNGANWSTRLTTPVELPAGSPGDISGAVNFINVAAQSFNQNDLVRITIPGVAVNQGAFHVSIYGELS